jgi:hypothetical protein
MKLKISKIKAFAILVVLAVFVAVIASIFWYYHSYPSNFQIDGKFSARGISISESFQNSRINASSFLYRTFQEDDKFNLTIGATRGWAAKSLTIYNASMRRYPIIYDTILFQTNGSVSLQIRDARFLFVNPENLGISIFTAKADSVFFIAEAGGSLLMENVTLAQISFSKGNPVIDFQVVDGIISVQDCNPSFVLNNKGGIVAIRLEMEVIAEAEMVGIGKFGIESNAFSSVTLDCWSAPLTAYFPFAGGFLSYSNTIQQLSRSQNLNLTGFRGEITLLNPQAPHEIALQGYTDRIFIGESEVTAPSLYRDFIQPILQMNWPSTLVGAGIGMISTIFAYEYKRWRDRTEAMTLIKEQRKGRVRNLAKKLPKMYGPYSVDELCEVEAGYIGVYALSRNGMTIHYVGRSDSDLRGRLSQSILEGEGYRYFWFAYETSPMRAYKRECVLFHRYNPVDNTVHPAVPPNANWRCPVKGCPWGK